MFSLIPCTLAMDVSVFYNRRSSLCAWALISDCLYLPTKIATKSAILAN